MTYVAVLLLFVLFAGVAMTVNEGLWSNTVTLLCTLLGGLLAWHWGPVLGEFVIEQTKPSVENEWAFWFATVWGVFFLAVTLLRVIADRSSRVRMRFIRPLDMAGGILMGLFVAVMFSSFAAYALFIPIRAGVWKTEDAAPWAQQTIQKLASPMYSAGRAFYGDEFPVLTPGS
jgi:hypothetical protein